MRQFLPGVFLIAALLSVFVPHVNSQDGATTQFDPAPSWSPDGDKIVFSYFTDNQYDLWVVDKDVQNLQRVTDTPDIFEVIPRYSPDGKYISFMTLPPEQEQEIELWILELSTQETLNLTGQINGGVENYSWSPDSMSIALTTNTLLTRTSFILSIETSISSEIDTGNDDLRVFSPVWSPDGTQIAFATSDAETTASHPTGNGLWVANVLENGELSEIRQIIFRQFFNYIRWLADSKTIIANGVGDSKLDIFQVDVENGHIINLTQDYPFIVGWATLSPAGDKVAFSSLIPDNLDFSEIRIVDIDLESSEPLTVGQGRFPEWSPDDKNVVFETSTSMGYEIRLYNVAEKEIETLVSPMDFE